MPELESEEQRIARLPWFKKPHNGKTVVYVVRVNNFWPELCELTIPTLKYYASKIGADFVEIGERKYPDFPATYEKVQVYDLGKDNKWNILFDADFIIHPLAPDVRECVPFDTIGIDYGYDASAFLDTSDKYFLRYGQNRGLATGFVVTNNVCHDLWTPLEFDWSEAQKYVKRKHIVDEYCLSRNLAKFGLKYVGILQEEPEVRKNSFIHLGSEDKSGKEKRDVVELAKRYLEEWGF